MPQTKFVTGKALALGLRPIVVVNKFDRPDERIQEVLDEVFDLFVSLDASDEQLDFPVLYASGRNGYAGLDADTRSGDLTPMFETIVNHVPDVGGMSYAIGPSPRNQAARGHAAGLRRPSERPRPGRQDRKSTRMNSSH